MSNIFPMVRGGHEENAVPKSETSVSANPQSLPPASSVNPTTDPRAQATFLKRAHYTEAIRSLAIVEVELREACFELGKLEVLDSSTLVSDLNYFHNKIEDTRKHLIELRARFLETT